jgi:hypothetical protein
MRAVSPVGGSSWPCCSHNWPTLVRCGRSATGWRLAASEGKLRHLGIPQAPNKSTLAYANEKRPGQLYQTLFGQLLERCQSVARGKKKFRFKNKLLSLDSTSIDLCAEVYDWARYKSTTLKEHHATRAPKGR